MDFKDKVVIVTGASVGMGRATAVKFGAAGAKVVVNYASAEKDATETVDTITRAGGTAILCQANVAQPAEAERIVATAVENFGRLDVLVNNAGVTAFIPFSDLEAAADPEIWIKLYSTNVVGAFLCATAAAREMRKSGGGVIINNASVSAHRPAGSSIPYCSSKAALLHMTRCLAVTLGPDIRVNSVSPGYIEDTRWNVGRENFNWDKALVDAADAAVLKRTGRAEEVANAILYLASSESSYSTGVDMLVDGGRYYNI